MFLLNRTVSIVATVPIAAFLFFVSGPFLEAGTSYFVDCRSEAEEGSGSRQDPWRTLAAVNRHTFQPGDRVLFNRGSLCTGQLRPQGSGDEKGAITLGAYGVGDLPVIDGGTHQAALYLFNQEYWHIGNLEIRGGSPYGVLVTGDEGTLRHIQLRDLTVHGGSGTPPDKRTALVAVLAGDGDQTFEDILIQGVTAYETTQWAGIVVDGGAPPLPRGAEGKNQPTLRARNVIIRNCLVHDVGGDGIILFRVENGLIEKSVAWNTGMMHLYTDEGPKNPNAIWSWNCHRCTVQFTEGFQADSAGVDGGVYDIDWGSSESTIQYNYGHDSLGYCLSVFGAGGTETTTSRVRYNLCVNNGRSPRLAKRQGDIYLSTWGGGSLDGVEIYNNTIFWNPATPAPAIKNEATFTGNRANRFFDNLIVSTAPFLVDSTEGLDFDSNLYWHTGSGSPWWRIGEREGRTLTALDGAESAGSYQNPFASGPVEVGAPFIPFAPGADLPAAEGASREHDTSTVDVFGMRLPENRSRGAIQGPVPSFDAEGMLLDPDRTFTDPGGKRVRIAPTEWALVTFLQLDDDSESLVEEQSQTVFLRSAYEQFAPKGLQIYLVVPERAPEQLINRISDWHLEGFTVLRDEGNRLRDLLELKRSPATLLIDHNLRVRRSWERLALPAELGLLLRSVLGPPRGHPPIEADSFGR